MKIIASTKGRVRSTLRLILHRNRSHALLAASLCAAAFEASAQSLDYGALEELFGEPVTTSVTGSPQVASHVPATMEIITADAIRRSGATDIPQVLRNVTGVDLLRWTNSGVDMGLRGYNSVFSPRLLVLVNGRQVYADHYGYTPWISLPVELEEIRQIEVVKGPNSALFGFNSAGGVINIVTFSPAHDRINYARVSAGTQDLVAASAARTLAPFDGWDMRISAGVRKNSDFGTPQRQVNLGTRRGDERLSLRMHNHFRLSATVEAEVEGSWTSAALTDMVPTYTMAFEEMEVGSLKGTLGADTAFGLLRATLYHNSMRNQGYAGRIEGDKVVESDVPLVDFHNTVSVAQLEDVFKVGVAHTLRLSAEYRYNQLDTTPVTGATVFYDVLAGGAMWQWQLAETLTLTSAVRRDYLELGRRGSLPPGYGLVNEDWDRVMSATSYNLGLVWAAGDNDVLRLSAARGAQLPSLFNLGGFLLGIPAPSRVASAGVLYVSGLPGVDPTRITSRELAWDHALPAANANFTLALFHGTSRNVLASSGGRLFSAGIVAGPANIGDSRTHGLEVSAHGDIADTWRWTAGYLYQQVDDEFAAQFPVGRTTTDFESTTPEHSANASLGWARGPWEVDVALKYHERFQSIRGGARPGEPSVLDPVPSYLAADARVAYRIDNRLVLALAGQNLLTRDQRQTAGPNVERQIVASLTWSL